MTWERPVVCLDQCGKQLIGEVRTPLPPAPGTLERDRVWLKRG